MIKYKDFAMTVSPYSLGVGCILEKPLAIGGCHDIIVKNKKIHKKATRVVHGTGGALLKISGTGPHTPHWYPLYMGTPTGKINNLCARYTHRHGLLKTIYYGT